MVRLKDLCTPHHMPFGIVYKVKSTIVQAEIFTVRVVSQICYNDMLAMLIGRLLEKPRPIV